MKALNPYLTFNGNAREAMRFYAGALEAQLDIFNAGQMPDCAPGQKGLVLHATLHAGSFRLMASDNLSARPTTFGDNVQISIDCASAAEQDRLFAALGEEGEVRMPLQNTFWGARFGMLTDRFGLLWMFNFDATPAA